MEPFKNFFSPALVEEIAFHLDRHLDTFDRDLFLGSILSDLENLELKARAQVVADVLHETLPRDPKSRRDVLRAMLNRNATPDEESGPGGISGWGVMPLSMVVGQHGVSEFDESLELLREMTKNSSSEFAVRYFLLEDQERALRIMQGWVTDPDQHVRRLVSEGTRPRLPWAMQLPQLIADPSPMLPILLALRDDDEEYVRRSVANHLNDIAKDHPDVVATLAVEWIKDADTNRQRLVRRATRTLIKAGNPIALEAFGLGPPKIDLESFAISTPTVLFGEALQFSAELRSTAKEEQSLVIDYLVHFRKANGRLVGKVFKWKQITLAAGEVRSLARSHPIRPITTRRYYAGDQGLSLRINGRDFGDLAFVLDIPNDF